MLSTTKITLFKFDGYQFYFNVIKYVDNLC